MTRDDLVKKAVEVTPPSPDCAGEFQKKSGIMAAELDSLMLKRTDLEKLIGPDNQAMMSDNHSNHARFMASLLRDYRPEVLVDTILWVFRAYRAHGFHLTYWPAQLNAWLKVLEKHLSSESFQQVSQIYAFMIVNQPAFARLSNPEEGRRREGPAKDKQLSHRTRILHK